jgi:hypothetical protein
MAMNQKIKHLQENIQTRSYILTGSVIEQYKRCGKLNCRCSHEDKKYWHGPYWIWTRKENGKTVTKTLNKDQAQFVKKAIKEMKKLNLAISKWKTISAREIDQL